VCAYATTWMTRKLVLIVHVSFKYRLYIQAGYKGGGKQPTIYNRSWGTQLV
jgi:hypothetical protein